MLGTGTGAESARGRDVNLPHYRFIVSVLPFCRIPEHQMPLPPSSMLEDTMPDAEKSARRSGLPVALGIALFVIAVGLAIFLLRRDRGESRYAADVVLGDSTATLPPADTAAAERSAAMRSPTGLGGGGATGPTALFEGIDIHEVPLGTILDYAQRLTYDEARGHEMKVTQQGRTTTMKIWPEAGASSLDETTLRQGRIVARIESSSGHPPLGLADGLNYLWVEGRTGGGYRGVIIPATAFVPLHDLDRVAISERTPSGVPLEKGAYWVNQAPWIACGRC